MTGNPTQQYRMKLNNIKQAGHATFEVTVSLARTLDSDEVF